MPKTDRPGPRSLTWILVGIAVFVAVLATLPVPEVADGPAPGRHEENFAIVDVTLFDGEAFRHGWDVWVEDGRIRPAGLRLDLPEDLFRRLAATAPDGHGTQHETSVQTLADPDEAAGRVGARKAGGLRRGATGKRRPTNRCSHRCSARHSLIASRAA